MKPSMVLHCHPNYGLSHFGSVGSVNAEQSDYLYWEKQSETFGPTSSGEP